MRFAKLHSTDFVETTANNLLFSMYVYHVPLYYYFKDSRRLRKTPLYNNALM